MPFLLLSVFLNIRSDMRSVHFACISLLFTVVLENARRWICLVTAPFRKPHVGRQVFVVWIQLIEYRSEQRAKPCRRVFIRYVDSIPIEIGLLGFRSVHWIQGRRLFQMLVGHLSFGVFLHVLEKGFLLRSYTI